MLDEWRRTLADAAEKLKRREELSQTLDYLTSARRDLDSRRLDLKAALSREKADVDALERLTLTNVFYTILGQKEQKLRKEEAEAYAAWLKYQSVVKELDDCERQLTAIGQERSELAKYETVYRDTYNNIVAELKNDPAAAERICALEQARGENDAQLRELREAISAGEAALSRIASVEASLKKAEDWGTVDAFTRGGIISHVEKHSALDAAQYGVEELQVLLRRFRSELADVNLEGVENVNIDGFTRFADWFFDGLFVDFSVLNRIRASQSGVADVRRQVNNALARVRKLQSLREGERLRLQAELDALVRG